MLLHSSRRNRFDKAFIFLMKAKVSACCQTGYNSVVGCRSMDMRKLFTLQEGVVLRVSQQ